MVTTNSTIEDLDKSRSRSFVTLWPVAEAYQQVIDGYVCALVGGTLMRPGALHTHPDCHRYLPMAHPEIPSAFAKAATGTESDILTFVHHYGLLGYDRAWRIPEELMGVRTLSKGQHDMAAFQHGDPIAWVVAHARTVKLLLHLIGTLDDPAAIQGAIDELRVRRLSPNGTHEESIDYLAAERGYLYPSPTQIAPMPPRQAALFIVSTVLEKNLTGVSRTLLMESKTTDARGSPRCSCRATSWIASTGIWRTRRLEAGYGGARIHGVATSSSRRARRSSTVRRSADTRASVRA